MRSQHLVDILDRASACGWNQREPFLRCLRSLAPQAATNLLNLETHDLPLDKRLIQIQDAIPSQAGLVLLGRGINLRGQDLILRIRLVVGALHWALILRGVHTHGTLLRDYCLIILSGKMLVQSPEGNLLV